MSIPASNRQKKLLRFFGKRWSLRLSAGAAGWEIADIMASEGCRERWRKYLYLTNDFGFDSDALKPFDPTQLESVVVPGDWNSHRAIEQFKEELVADMLRDESPFDRPQPKVILADRSFMFTGKFAFGPRKKCQQAIILRGGSAPDYKSVTQNIDYLVIGVQGSPTWTKGSYGNKIEEAILARREYGTPAIISEHHWSGALDAA